MKIAEKLKIALKKALSLEFGRLATDKQELVFDGELAEGTEVFVEDENAELVPAADGEYVAEDGRTIVVAEGKVTEIREKEPENEPENVEEEVAAEDIVDEPAEEPADTADEEPEGETMEDRMARLESIVNGFAEGVERIINAIAALEARVEDLENKVNDLANEPAAEPVEEVAAEEEKPKSKLAYLRKN